MNDRNIGTCLGGGHHSCDFCDLICPQNLFTAFEEFKRGKTSKIDVGEFQFNLENNLFQLHDDLKNEVWRPDIYQSFYVRDPKLRHIHKASTRDRVFNQAVFRILYPVFDKTFIHDSYSCRLEKGTHKGVLRLEEFARKVTQNYSRPSFALKCDVRKFFDNISHDVLFKLIKNKVKDEKILGIIGLILKSFETKSGVGLPLGNVTSQLFANVYLNELDQFVKHVLKRKYYLRYCDDFIILSKNREELLDLLPQLNHFLYHNLKLELHPNKIHLRKISQGIDFLGYVVLPHYKVLRTKTKRRIYKKIKILKSELDKGLITQKQLQQKLASYLGILKHCYGNKIRLNIEKILDLQGE